MEIEREQCVGLRTIRKSIFSDAKILENLKISDIKEDVKISRIGNFEKSERFLKDRIN